MKRLPELFERNRRWSERMQEADPEAFKRLAAIQRPEYLSIGCSDSRVLANQVVDLPPVSSGLRRGYSRRRTKGYVGESMIIGRGRR